MGLIWGMLPAAPENICAGTTYTGFLRTDDDVVLDGKLLLPRSKSPSAILRNGPIQKKLCNFALISSLMP
jgi:hypothetical protein